MQAKDLMCETVICCTPDTNLGDVARLMNEHDCGAIPVVESAENKKLAGVVTDRDIVCRILAQGHNPLELTARDCMSSPVHAVHADTDEAELCQQMEKHQVRRMLVTDDQSTCIGIVSQADIARLAPEQETAEVVRDISRPHAAG